VSHYHLTWLLQFELKRDVMLNVDTNHLLYLHPFNKMVIKEELQGRQGMVMKRLRSNILVIFFYVFEWPSTYDG